MPDSRSAILSQIRQSLAAARLPPAPSVELPSSAVPPPPSELAEKFAQELRALNGAFLSTRQAEAAALVARLVRERGAGRVLAWGGAHLPVPGLLDALRQAGVQVDAGEVPPGPDRAQRLADLETIAVGLTGVDAAVAETGTLVLLAGPGRPRLAAMSVRAHIAVFTPDQLHATLAAWLHARPDLADALRARSAALFVTGPSRTADIEMTLTVGVHGPGEVIAVLVEP